MDSFPFRGIIYQRKINVIKKLAKSHNMNMISSKQISSETIYHYIYIQSDIITIS